VNGADGISDIEGKVARVSDEGDGKRPSFKSVAKLMPVRLGPSQFEFEMRFRSVKGRGSHGALRSRPLTFVSGFRLLISVRRRQICAPNSKKPVPRNEQN